MTTSSIEAAARKLAEIICPTCGGTGEQWNIEEGHYDCPDCNGTGYEFHRLRVECLDRSLHWHNETPKDSYCEGWTLPPPETWADICLEWCRAHSWAATQLPRDAGWFLSHEQQAHIAEDSLLEAVVAAKEAERG